MISGFNVSYELLGLLSLPLMYITFVALTCPSFSSRTMGHPPVFVRPTCLAPQPGWGKGASTVPCIHSLL